MTTGGQGTGQAGGNGKNPRQLAKERADGGRTKLEGALGKSSPLAEGIVDLVEGAVASSTLDIEDRLGRISVDEKARKVAEEKKLVEVQELKAVAQRVQQGQEDLSSKATEISTAVGRAEDEAKTASDALVGVQSMFKKLSVTDDSGKEFVGAAALPKLAEQVSAIPTKVGEAVDQALEVTLEDGSTLKGTLAVKYAVSEAKAAHTAAADVIEEARRASRDVEHSESLLETARGLVQDSNGLVAQAHEKASAAQIAAEAAEAAVKQMAALVDAKKVQAELTSFAKKMDVAIGAVMKILENNGMDTELSEAEMAEVQEEADAGEEETDLQSFKAKMDMAIGAIMRIFDKNGLNTELTDTEMEEVRREAEEVEDNE